MDLQIIRTRHPPDAYLEQLATILQSETPDINLDDLRRRLELLPGDDRFFLALDGEFLIGYAHLSLAHDLASDDTVELLNIIVSIKLRRQGVGHRLMTAAETWASQAERAKLVLRADVVRSEALAFFSSLGYLQSGTSQEYVRDLDATRRAEAPTQPQ
ncbi:MAG: GNAT family N-acetyltransferase [Anaerolineales bacterium]